MIFLKSSGKNREDSINLEILLGKTKDVLNSSTSAQKRRI